MREEREPVDAALALEADAKIRELLNNPCPHTGDCADKLLLRLLTGKATHIDQVKMGLWLDSFSQRLAEAESDREFVRGFLLLLAGPREDTKPH